MRVEKIYFNEEKTRHLTAYLLHDSQELEMTQLEKRPAMLIFPGGGYRFVSEREGEPIAMAFAAAGYQTFVLRYAINEEAVHPAPLLDAARAIALIRENAVDWHVDPSRIAVSGFSAGGHLAATLGILWDAPEVLEALGGDAARFRPDALVLGYAAVTDRKRADGQPRNPLFSLGLDQKVRPDMPPAFIWTTYEDELVPPKESLILAGAMGEAGVPYELHVYENGPHGLATADQATGRPNPRVAGWIPLALSWLELRRGK